MATRKGTTPAPPREEPAALLRIPADRTEQAAAFFDASKPQTLSERTLSAMLAADRTRGVALLNLQERLAAKATLYEADLAELIGMRAVRQLVMTLTSEGWELQVLPSWKQQFLTLVSLRNERRHYTSLDRLLKTITKHGPLPPTILIGD